MSFITLVEPPLKLPPGIEKMRTDCKSLFALGSTLVKRWYTSNFKMKFIYKKGGVPKYHELAQNSRFWCVDKSGKTNSHNI